MQAARRQPHPAWLQRFHSQGLTDRPATTAYDVVDRLLAVQAQDLRGARLAIRARSTGVTAVDVDAAIDDGSLVVGWLNRGTLHLVAREDYWWLHALTTPPLVTSNQTRLRQEGVDADAAERGVKTILRALDRDGPLPRAELRDRVRAAGVAVEGQAMVHLLFLAALRGDIIRGPFHGQEQTWVRSADWVAARPADVDRDKALAELARRYLRSHAPATDRDLARWAGLALRDARAGMSAIEEPKGRAARPSYPKPRLLGAFEPVLLGWTSREDLLVSAPAKRTVTDNGLFRPFLFVGGEAVGTWRWSRQRVELEPFEPLDDDAVRALEKDAADVVRFLTALTRHPGAEPADAETR